MKNKSWTRSPVITVQGFFMLVYLDCGLSHVAAPSAELSLHCHTPPCMSHSFGGNKVLMPLQLRLNSQSCLSALGDMGQNIRVSAFLIHFNN